LSAFNFSKLPALIYKDYIKVNQAIGSVIIALLTPFNDPVVSPISGTTEQSMRHESTDPVPRYEKYLWR